MEENGDGRHVEFLHEEFSDPSEEVAKRLATDIGEKGSIVVYHADMERGVLQYLADRFPEHADALNSMINRIWDLEVLFKDHYRDWRFGSKSSIKVVLRNLIPKLSHQNLGIQEGGAASLAWIEILESNDADFKRKKAKELKEYCKRDTFAMVELLKLLMSVQRPVQLSGPLPAKRGL